MSKKHQNEIKSQPLAKVAALEIQNDGLVEIKALKQVNTTLFGNFKEGQKGKVSAILAKQLKDLGEVEIL